MKRLTVTIGIPAHNEEKNIQPLIESILKQELYNCVISKIIILLDGSTDNTKREIRKIKNKKVIIVNDKKRLGKTARINELINMLNDDVLVLLDADIILQSKYTISHLVKPFINTGVGLTGGKLVQGNNTTFIEHAIKASLNVYEEFKERLHEGNNIFSIKGAMIAISKTFAKSVHIPSDVYANDAYLYFDCITRGYKFQYIKYATALYQVPSNLKDQIEQNMRFAGAQDNLQKYFGNIVDKEYSQNRTELFTLKAKYFISDPFHSFPIFFINLYSKFKAKKYARENNVTWTTVKSTKRAIVKIEK